MKNLLYAIAIFGVFWFVTTNFGIIASLVLALLLIACIIWNKRVMITTYLASQAYFVKGDREKAYNRYQSAYKSGYMTPDGKISFAAFCLYTGKYEKCRRLLTSVVNSSIASAECRTNAKHYLAILTWKEGDLDEAIAQMEVVHKESTSTGTYGTLGAFYVEKAKRDGCFHTYLDFMLEAYDYNDIDKTICDNLGELYLYLGEYIKAEEMYIKLFKTAQTSPVPYFHYGQVLKNLGKTEEAKANFEKALTCNFARALTVSRDMIKDELENLQ